MPFVVVNGTSLPVAADSLETEVVEVGEQAGEIWSLNAEALRDRIVKKRVLRCKTRPITAAQAQAVQAAVTGVGQSFAFDAATAISSRGVAPIADTTRHVRDPGLYGNRLPGETRWPGGALHCVRGATNLVTSGQSYAFNGAHQATQGGDYSGEGGFSLTFYDDPQGTADIALTDAPAGTAVISFVGRFVHGTGAQAQVVLVDGQGTEQAFDISDLPQDVFARRVFVGTFSGQTPCTLSFRVTSGAGDTYLGIDQVMVERTGGSPLASGYTATASGDGLVAWVMPAKGMMGGARGLTLSAWLTEPDQDAGSLVQMLDLDVGDGVQLSYVSPSLHTVKLHNNQAEVVQDAGSPSLWAGRAYSHVAVVVQPPGDATYARAYVQGVLVGELVPPIPGAAPMGYDAMVLGQFSGARIDDVAVYPYAMDAASIAQLVGATGPTGPLPYVVVTGDALPHGAMVCSGTVTQMTYVAAQIDGTWTPKGKVLDITLEEV